MKRTLRQMLMMAFAYIVVGPAAAQSLAEITLGCAGSIFVHKTAASLR
jgi:hypothetical protein